MAMDKPGLDMEEFVTTFGLGETLEFGSSIHS
jgi:hypothetical protein